MTDLIDRIGPILGIVAFLALAALAVLLFLEAREVRRLREWAGRAPERAAEAAEATFAAAEARGEEPGEERQGIFGRIREAAVGAWHAVGDRLESPYRELDRRSPIDPRILLALLVAAIAAAVVLTSGFGLFGDSGGGKQSNGMPAPGETKVAVLNGSQEQGVAGVPGLANSVLRQVVKPAGYRAGQVTDAPASFPKTVVMYSPGNKGPAKALATSVKPKLGATETQAMSSEVKAVVGKTPLVLVIGVDDASFGTSGP